MANLTALLGQIQTWGAQINQKGTHTKKYGSRKGEHPVVKAISLIVPHYDYPWLKYFWTRSTWSYHVVLNKRGNVPHWKGSWMAWMALNSDTHLDSLFASLVDSVNPARFSTTSHFFPCCKLPLVKSARNSNISLQPWEFCTGNVRGNSSFSTFSRACKQYQRGGGSRRLKFVKKSYDCQNKSLKC